MIVLLASPLARMHSEWVLAYLVVVGDGASGRGGASAVAPGASSMHVDSTMRAATPRAAREARRRVATPATAKVASVGPPPMRSVALARPSAPASGVAAVGHDSDRGAAGGGATAGGDGTGSGDGPDSIARADYASNPAPIYPAVARRREQQGTVTVRALIGADGSVERAEIADSSGFDKLDDAALETVRSRWRFVPARRGGIAVESWVLVPIRFALVEADAVR
jgi:protein TonB